MKNTIIYYYNLVPSTIQQKDNIYYIKIDNKNYIFMPYENNINDLLTIYNYLLNIKLYCHELIYNLENNLITMYKNQQYILIKINYNSHKLIDIEDINQYNIYIDNQKKCNWNKLWSIKIDYYEIQLREFGKKYPLIRDSFSYYNGLCETAIILTSSLKDNNINMYLSHKRINPKMTLDNFYNPLNLTIDVRVRDISEYFKNKFFYRGLKIDEVQYYLFQSKLNYYEIVLLFARLLYPTYYFDVYDEIIQGKTKEDKLYNYINKTKTYEKFLRQVYFLLNKYYKIPEIEWIIKM